MQYFAIFLLLGFSACFADTNDDIVIDGSTVTGIPFTKVDPPISPSTNVPTSPVSPNTTTPIPNTSTAKPTVTTSSTTTTPKSTTSLPTTPSSTTPKSTTTPKPTEPTTPNSTAAPATTTTPPHHDRKFDGPSFVGGIILALGLVAIGFVAFKFYKARTELNYHTL